jgi:hypothetical protein
MTRTLQGTEVLVATFKLRIVRLSMGEANASRVVKDACMSDYAAYCNGLKVGTAALRSCMKSHSTPAKRESVEEKHRLLGRRV